MMMIVVPVVGSNNAKLPAVVSPKKKKARKEITFWTLPKDVSSFLDAPGRQSARFTVRGEPQSLRRPGPRRSSFHSKCKTQGRPLFNPSRGKQQSFRKAVEGLLPARLHSSRLLFPEGAKMVVTIDFLLRRPNDHFVGAKRGIGLKESAPRGYAVGRSDIDNLAKFILDCLSGLLYKDDRNVVSLVTTKTWDSDGTCEGATVVQIKHAY
jgi:Holliday junction resolvase RusA-like endonuclease